MKHPIRVILAGMTLVATMPLAYAAENGSYPEVCKSGMTMAPESMKMDGMMKDHQKAAMDGMMTMDDNMMQGMMKDDADVAFVCGMIAHHQGAIDMANVELKYGDDDWSKKMAKMIIAAQTKEIAEMTAWLKDNAK